MTCAEEAAADGCTITVGFGEGAGRGAAAATAGTGWLGAASFSLPSLPSIRLPNIALPAIAGIATATQPESDVPANASSGSKIILRSITRSPSPEPS
jgi:hypothetical protein